MTVNTFTPGWYTTFLDTIPNQRTNMEIAFVERFLPAHEFGDLIDIGCGPARHAEALGNADYSIVGIDTDAPSIALAREKNVPNAEFHTLDMRELSALKRKFDGAINLWHSFGYYDEATNARILRSISDRLRKGGRAVFDLYNREHMRNLPAEIRSERAGGQIVTQRMWQGKRMQCVISYEAAPPDRLDWHIYDPNEFSETAVSNGFVELVRCTNFDPDTPPSAEHPGMQFVFEKV